jgi:hypothetical protein
MKFDAYHKEVEKALKNSEKTIPAQRAVHLNGYSFSKLDPQVQFAIWDHFWFNSENNSVKNQSFFYIERQIKKEPFLKANLGALLQWQQKVNDWPHCDSLSKIFTRLLEIDEPRVLPILRAWNKSKNLWHRRQSIVSLLYYSRTKKKILDFDTIVSLVTPLIEDKEYYVQKGLGWTLRELFNEYPRETTNFLFQNHSSISSTAYAAATEKLNKELKAKLNQLRKASREKLHRN